MDFFMVLLSQPPVQRFVHTLLEQQQLLVKARGAAGFMRSRTLNLTSVASTRIAG
jgi:hypothetical protein